MAEPTHPIGPTTAPTATIPKGHNRRESSGHICTACDQCYRCKVKCSAEKPICERCRTSGSACTYSTGKPLGKPKGSKNKVQRPRASAKTHRRYTPPSNSEPQSSEWPLSSPTKRRSDGGKLPSAKRQETLSPIISQGGQNPSILPLSQFHSPSTSTSELYSLTPRLGSSHGDRDTIHLVAEPGPNFFESAKPDDSSQDQKSVGHKDDEVFASTDVDLGLEDFNWFTQAENYMATPLSTRNVQYERPLHDIHPPSTQTQPSQGRILDDVSFADASFMQLSPRLCFCDPTALSIISELQFLQTALSPLDTALLLARRGFSTVSSCLSCPSCLSSSRSLFYACILIMQQVFTCYGTVRVQSSKMLNFTAAQEHQKPLHSVVSIGDFEVEGEEGCHGVLDAIVKAEMERGRGVIGGLERWAQESGDGNQKTAGLLLRTLREEIGC